jgi:outer membrane protein assembly factor BamB
MPVETSSFDCIRATDGKFAWRAEVTGAGINADSQVFSPPALGGLNLYLCSVHGHLLSIGQADGKVGLLYMFKQPVLFQPALARGNIYVGTANGLLICLKTGDPDVDGWHARGGNAQHNTEDCI